MGRFDKFIWRKGDKLRFIRKSDQKEDEKNIPAEEKPDNSEAESHEKKKDADANES